MSNLFKKLQSDLTPKQTGVIDYEGDHSRYKINNSRGNKILIKNIPFLFTCDENEKLRVFQNQSIIIENGIITGVEAKPVSANNFDIIYDAGKRGGTVVTPGFINTHAHPPMYLMRSAMMLDEGEDIDDTIAAMPKWERAMNEEDFAISTIGDLSEQQKYGITTTLSHYNFFNPLEYAAALTKQNLINAISVVSNARPENSPELIKQLLPEMDKSHSRLAIALHYPHKATAKILDEVKELVEKHGLLFTCHFAESEQVVKTCLEKHGLSEVELLEKHGLLNSNTILSHAIYLTDREIKKLIKNKVGISHLPTSNTIHKSGTFPFWKFYDNGGREFITLGTDGVVSKSRLDLLTEAYQTRLTHLYDRTVKFGSLFKMMTVNAARILNMPDRGRIVKGQKADLVFWKLRDRGTIPYDEGDPMTILGNIITHGGRVVRDLMVNGEFVIKNRRHQLIDESKLLSELQEHHMAMREKVGN
ncbi:MAG: amidohydrolase family protein [Patescibacteria group bacterium]|jgi:cytosine/adenosine deaminase-related metal-dependent hydrolase